jgi:hypothetical protein
MLGVDHKWLKARQLKAERFDPDNENRGSWYISRRTLQKFVLEHMGELTGPNVDLPSLFSLFGIGDA